jgi:2-keto-4-pentenoate hydratase/2-oxohepta-3-ene-1,7-dioic acid hydratase in catechol pathway
MIDGGVVDKADVVRIVRAERHGQIFYGKLGDKTVHLLRGGPFTGFEPSKKTLELSRCTLLSPVLPGKIVCVGMNYRAHVEEHGKEIPERPQLFFKPTSALIGPGERIVLPPESKQVEHEAELGVVIGKNTKRVSVERAMDHVLGFTCVNDVTARDLQREDDRWGRAKGFDTFCPVGPCVATGLDYGNLTVRCFIGTELRQEANTSDMIWDVPTLVSYISQAMTLYPGDLIATGTPSGVGPISNGDRVIVEIEGVGRLTNPVVSEKAK